jgi:L-threonylcarbamoyladenylate synthase
LATERLTAAGIDRAVEILRAGGLAAFPTETVYGLGADAANPAAIARLYRAKGRPQSHPVIVHCATAAAARSWCRDWPAAADRLAAAFWPGPLTLILPASVAVSRHVTGGQDSVGLRVPSHPMALELLRRFAAGVAAPSANKFGHVSPTTAEHVLAELDGDIDAVIDGGPCPVGVESSIVDLSGAKARLLRPGHITVAELRATIGDVLTPETNEAAPTRAPGGLAAHYAPATVLQLIDQEDLASALANAAETRLVVLAIDAQTTTTATVSWRRMPADAASYARLLYATLREVDRAGFARILVQRPPAGDAWRAIHDRLARASRGRSDT